MRGAVFGCAVYVYIYLQPAAGKIKMIAFDFDKTITRKHTQGAVQLPGQCTPEFIEANFADLEFFKFVVPFIKAQNCEVGIASFGEEEPDAILSGLTLVRAYLDHAFGTFIQCLPPQPAAFFGPLYVRLLAIGQTSS